MTSWCSTEIKFDFFLILSFVKKSRIVRKTPQG